MRTLFSRVGTLTWNREFTQREISNSQSQMVDVPDELAIEIDVNGSPVTVEEAHWFICFVPDFSGNGGIPSPTPGTSMCSRCAWSTTIRGWLVEPWWTRLMVNALTLHEAMRFLRWGAAGDIPEVREAIPGRGSQVRG